MLSGAEATPKAGELVYHRSLDMEPDRGFVILQDEFASIQYADAGVRGADCVAPNEIYLIVGALGVLPPTIEYENKA